MKFSDNCKLLRKKKGLTQEELGKKLNVSRKTISGWENNRAYPDIMTLLKISRLYNISINCLIDGEIDSDDKELTKAKCTNTIKEITHLTSSFINIMMLFFSYLNIINPWGVSLPFLVYIMTFNLIVWFYSREIVVINVKNIKISCIIGLIFLLFQANIEFSNNLALMTILSNGHISHYYWGQIAGILFRVVVVTFSFMIFLNDYKSYFCFFKS